MVQYTVLVKTIPLNIVSKSASVLDITGLIDTIL